MVKTEKLKLTTKKQFEAIDITAKVQAVLASSGISDGILVIFAPHTTASIKINHNEPLLLQDIMKRLYHLVPVDISYSHDIFEIRSGSEVGDRSNGHAHVKAFFLGASESIPVENKKLLLGEKQSIFFVELDGGRERKVIIQIIGE